MSNPKIQIKLPVLFVALPVLFLILYSFLGIAAHGVFSDRGRLSSAVDIDAMGERLSPLFHEINDFPSQVAQEILFLSKMSSLKRIAGNSNSDTYEELVDDFMAFAEKGGIYHELRYIDENGREKVHVEYIDKVFRMVPKSSVKNVIIDSYVEDIFRLSEGEVYISPVKLVDEASSTQKNIPVIYFGTPVVGNKGEPRGMVVVAIRADYFFDDIRRSSRVGEQVYLVDQDGQYLAHPEPEKEYSALLKTESNFANDYPDVSEEILSLFEKRRLESDTSIFSLRHIFPATANFALSNGSQKLYGLNPDRDFFWVLVSVADKAEFENKTNFFESYEFFMIFSGLLIALILGILVVILEIARRRTL